MNILMVAPNAPPKNSAEAIQVGRYLKELDKHHNITLVTTPVERSWVVQDVSLEIELSKTNIITLRLPLHRIVTRLLATQYFKRFLFPDKDFWICSRHSSLINQLDSHPDMIYSRSYPLSAALLAHGIKKKMGVPWIMHLSDPWSDNPYRTSSKIKNNSIALERYCFNEADSISVTTKSLAQFYRNKYPEFSRKIFTFPNVMPLVHPDTSACRKTNYKLTLVYTGALYGQRRPTTILQALELLAGMDQDLLNKINIQFVGNIAENISLEIKNFHQPQISILGRRNYNDVLALQAKADIMISIEPDGDDPLLKTFLPSKMLDYIAARKPVLAITPKNSESWKLCKKGYGWAIEPGDSKSLANLLCEFIKMHKDKNIPLQQSTLQPPIEYSATTCVNQLNSLMETLINVNHSCKFDSNKNE